MKPAATPSPSDTTIDEGFLHERIEVVRKTMLPYQWEALNDRIPGAERSACIHNLRLASGAATGEFHGMFWQDTDLYKWIEAVAGTLATHPDAALEQQVSETIALIAAAQQPDGYINTCFQLVAPEKRFTNLRDCHELYTAGHLIEAAVAWHEATGRTDFLEVATKLADLLVRTFGPREDQNHGYPGHEEVELALVRLAKATGKREYLDLAAWFIDQRGRSPNFFAEEAHRRGDTSLPDYAREVGFAYWQAHQPVREQTEPVGHAVRAMYLYSAMADLARERQDDSLVQACERLWRAVVHRHLYVTGGIGADGPGGERFSEPYDLPNDRAYAETCAAVGLVFFARRMLDLRLDAEFADVMELALYNNVLAGMSLDGTRFFYVNPLELRPAEARRRHDHRHVKSVRQPWFGCACCPPNIARLLTALGRYAASPISGGIAIHLYTGSTIRMSDGNLELQIRTDTPWEGRVSVRVAHGNSVGATIALRIPGWTRNPTLSINDSPPAALASPPASVDRWQLELRRGYLHVTGAWSEGDLLQLDFPMTPARLRAHPKVTAAAGCVALRRGPVVYCVEGIDNGGSLDGIVLPEQSPVECSHDKEMLGGCTTLKASARRIVPSDENAPLYREDQIPRTEPVELTFIPYALWANRGETEMRVWIRESQ